MTTSPVIVPKTQADKVPASEPFTDTANIIARVFSESQAQVSLRLRCHGTSASFWGNINGTSTSLCTLQRDAWYRVEAPLSPTSRTTSSTVRLFLASYSTGITSTYTFSSAITTSSTGLNSVLFNQSVTGYITDITLDNVELTSGDPLLAQ